MTKKMLIKNFISFLILTNCCSVNYVFGKNKFGLSEVFSWKQLSYNFDGVKYERDVAHERKPGGFYFSEEVDDRGMFFTQYNNIPIGFEVYKDIVFITVPRRRYGIPSTLNYVDLRSGYSSPLLKPYPSVDCVSTLVSVYRPRLDVCDRLWMVDTGLLEVPNNFEQKKQPQIIVFDLKTHSEILRYDIPSHVLVNGTTSGLTSITVDVIPSRCDDAYAYINDLAREGMLVSSLKQKDIWRINHQSFRHDDSASNFTVAGQVLNWRDGLFSIALSKPDADGGRMVYYHPFISTQEFAIFNGILKDKSGNLEGNVLAQGSTGTQSASHDYHSGSQVLLFANIARDAIMCWNTLTPLNENTVAIVSQNPSKLVYITDLKVKGDDVWVLVNQIPRFIYSRLNTNETNFYMFRGRVKDLIANTVCEK